MDAPASTRRTFIRCSGIDNHEGQSHHGWEEGGGGRGCKESARNEGECMEMAQRVQREKEGKGGGGRGWQVQGMMGMARNGCVCEESGGRGCKEWM